MKSQTVALKKYQETETADLNDITTLISSFAKDQVSQKPLEANGRSPETAAVVSSLKLNAILKKLRSDPWRDPGNHQQSLSRAVGDHSLVPNEYLMSLILLLVSIMVTSDHTASTTELDSHANIIVVGKHDFLFSQSGQ